MTLKTEVSVMWRMSAGREFQTDGPATKMFYARSPNLVTVGGTVYDNGFLQCFDTVGLVI